MNWTVFKMQENKKAETLFRSQSVCSAPMSMQTSVSECSSNKDMLLSMYNKSIDFQNQFQNWKTSTLNEAKFDITRFNEQKELKMQAAMSKLIIIIK